MKTLVNDLLRRLAHLPEQFHELRDGLERAVRIAADDPEMALTRTRKILEFVVRDVFTRRCQESPGTRPLENLLQRLVKDGHLPTRLEAYANTVRMLGNVGTHRFGEAITAADVSQSLTQLIPVLEWYVQEERPEILAVEPAARPVSVVASRRRGRRRLWLAIGVCELAAILVLTGALPRPGQPNHEARTPPASVVAVSKVQVLSLDVMHFANQGESARKLGVLGKQSFAARCGDSVTVAGKLSRPAYAYLIAFCPDGKEVLCFPEEEDEVDVPPALTDRPGYPSVSRGVDFGLDEGEGLQAFVLVVSEQPLPAYNEWRRRLGAAAWTKHATPAGIVWQDDGTEVAALTADDLTGVRGKGRAVLGKTPLARLADWLRHGPGVETTVAVGFAVLPAE